MGRPAARIGDMHVCPMVTGVVPHVGGPVVGPGVPTVLIGGMPAVTMGDMCTCTGPPDSIILGSTGVLIGGKPAARLGDMTSHGGTITLGCLTVLIGETSAGMAAIPLPVLKSMAKSISGPAKAIVQQAANMAEAAEKGDPLVHNSLTCSVCAENSSDSS